MPGRNSPWTVELFQRHREDDPTEVCPAESFLLDECPKVVAKNLFATIDAVAEAPPPQFTGGGRWEAMHGEMTGFYEARAQGPDHRLYRLFCLLERESPGLSGPSIVLIAGMSKPIGETFTEAEYAAVRRLGEEYLRRVPRSVAKAQD